MEDWKYHGLTTLGRLAALEIAVRALIDRSHDGEAIREEIAQISRSSADSLIGDGSNLDRATMAFGLIEGAEQITERDSI